MLVEEVGDSVMDVMRAVNTLRSSPSLLNTDLGDTLCTDGARIRPALLTHS